jgi:cytoplasmic tRNA 2-thiolation protein 1
MPSTACVLCHGQRPAALVRPKTSEPYCKICFFEAFEREIHETIVKEQLFKPGETIAIAASGGKGNRKRKIKINHFSFELDSTVLAYVMKLLNERHSYGLKLVLLSIDEGITGYRDDSLETVKRNQQQYDLPLIILTYKELYGWSMVKRKSNS